MSNRPRGVQSKADGRVLHANGALKAATVQADLKRFLDGAKLPKMGVLQEEWRRLTQRKRKLYGEYQIARRDMWEVMAAKANIDYLLDNAGLKTRTKQKR